MPEPKDSSAESPWSPATRFTFRFVFSYLSLYMVTFAPRIFRTPIARTYVEIWNPMVAWVGKHVVGIASPIELFIGDTTLEYVLILCIGMVALSAAVVWSLADFKWRNYAVLHEWLRLAVRLWLATYLISYGAGKVFPGQFLQPSPARYIGSYGDSSPMGLLWTFMGVSPGYQSFAGAIELSAGLLLIIPPLTSLGALLAIAAVTNVLALNMAYDVQVKVFSAHLLVAALFLITPDLRKLTEFFILRRMTELRRPAPLLQSVWMNRALLGFQLAFGLYAATIMLIWSHERVKNRAEISQHTPFYGIWVVDDFVRDGTSHPPLTTDDVRWQRVVIESPSSVVLQMMNGTLRRCSFKLDQSAHTAEISGQDPDCAAKFVYTSDRDGMLTIQGVEKGHVTNLKLNRVEPKFLLDTRGIRWVHSYPPLFR